MNTLEFARRRDRLMAAIGPKSVAVIAGAKDIRRNGDTHYPFRQESDFFYLTGFAEPNALLVLTPLRKEGEVTIFVNPRDPGAEQWNGRRLGVEAAPQVLGVDHAYDVAEIDKQLPQLIEGRQAIHAHFGFDSSFDQRVFSCTSNLKSQRKLAPQEFVDLSHSLHELRVIKSPHEQECMQRAADITVRAHMRAMESCKPGLYEWHLEAALISEFMSNGARHAAYPSIVASGENACIMHYVDNNATLNANDLVLIDAGCELDHYASDVTRTFPVSGRFSDRQKELYELCLFAQERAITSAKPGAKFNDPHDTARQVLTQGLIDLGIINGPLDAALEQNDDRRFLVHRCSHWLGLDVHDAGAYVEDGKSRAFEPGMVLTIEPGIYIPSNESMKDVDSKWRGIGIRIEDDVLITPEGNQVLTAEAPKNVDEIESLMEHGL